MSAALVGYTGFVGTNLVRQRPFDALFNSLNIEQIAGRSFELVVCAGAPAEKWKANAQPEKDLDNIERLTRALEQVNAERVVLISTVDVFLTPIGVDEESPTPLEGLHAYGRHRRRLEQIVASRFDALIVRLPALYGHGLKKNIIYDLLHDNDVHKIDSRGVFQFYGLDRLWRDIEVGLLSNLGLVHLATAPVSVAEIARVGFGIDFTNEVAPSPARYDVHSKHAASFGGTGHYVEDKPRELAGIAAYVARERKPRG